MFKTYTNNRLIAEDALQFYVIVPEMPQPVVPLACPICDRLLRSREDECAFIEYSCCDLCAMRWAHSRKEAWKSGWRPSSADVETEVAARPTLLVNFNSN